MLLKLVHRYGKTYWIATTIVILAQIIQTLANLWLPSLNADIIDKGVVTGDTSQIWYYGKIMLGMTAIQLTASIVALYFGARTGTRIAHDIRRDMFQKVQGFSRNEMHHFEASSLITRATNDVQQVQMFVIMTLTFVIMAPIMGVGGIVMAIRQDAELSLLLLIAVPALAAVLGTLMWRLHPLFKQMQERTDNINSVLREQLSGVRVIRAFVRQNAERARFGEANHELRQTALGIGTLFALMFPAVNLIIGLTSTAVIWFGALRIDSGGMQIGSMVAFLNYLMQIFFAVMMMSFMLLMAPRAVVCAERITAVLRTEAQIKDPQTPANLRTSTTPALPGTFAFEDVAVQYPGAQAPVIAGLSAQLRPGTTTAIIGSIGSGKSTAAALLPRLVDPTSGAITYNGTDIRELKLNDLRARIAYVPQTPYLFSGTIASAVTGKASSDLTESERTRLERALETAQANEFLSELAEGIDSRLETGGKNFSGGQKQRLTIARALYRDADLYIFDDSFSALDYATEARLRTALAKTQGEAATLVIAQRVSSIENADQILVLDAGAVVGKGTHQELLENCQTYQEIVNSQAAKEDV